MAREVTSVAPVGAQPDSRVRDRRYLAEMLLSHAREELTRIDLKASLLLASAGMIIGVIAGVVASRGGGPKGMSRLGVALWWVGTFLEAASLVQLGRAVYPHTSRKNPQGLLAFYGDAKDLTSDQLQNRLDESAAHVEEVLTDQFHSISRIVSRKYAFVKSGMILLAAGVPAWALAVTLG
jgi:hypothetical protein